MKPNFKLSEARLVVGIGNPGLKYAHTYHNAGILFLEFLNENISPPKLHTKVTDIEMNKSGGAVKKFLSYYKASPRHLVVAHDDSDIVLGSYKINFARGSAGHNGVASIIKA